MNKYKKNLTDEDIQVLKNTMQKHNDIKSPIELMTQSIVTEQEKGLLRLMYFRFTDYIIQKQRADELEKRWNELKQTLLLYKNVPQKTQSFDTVFELMKEMELEKENE